MVLLVDDKSGIKKYGLFSVSLWTEETDTPSVRVQAYCQCVPIKRIKQGEHTY